MSNKENCEFLVQERFYWIRILKKYNVLYFETSKETWKKAISKTPCGIVKKLATAVITFLKRDSDYFKTPHITMKKEHLTPLLIAAYDGDLDFFQKLNEKNSDPNQTKSEISPIHFAAYRGNLTLCKLLLNESENKNSCGILHFAALGGNLEVYKLLYDAAVVKNPKLPYCGTTATPLDLASIEGHLEILRFIIDNQDDKNPVQSNGVTLLHEAASRGKLDNCRIIIGNITDKNPAATNGSTLWQYG